MEESKERVVVAGKLQVEADLVLDRCLRHRVSGARSPTDVKATGHARICGHVVSNGAVYDYCDACAVQRQKCKVYGCGRSALNLSKWDAKEAQQVVEEKIKECQGLGARGVETVDRVYQPVLAKIQSKDASFVSFREFLEWCLILGQGVLPRDVCAMHWFAGGGGIMTMDRSYCRKCGGGTPSGCQLYHRECAAKEHKCFLCGHPVVVLAQFDLTQAQNIIEAFQKTTVLGFQPIGKAGAARREVVKTKLERQFALVNEALTSRRVHLWAQLHLFLNAVDRFGTRPANEWMLEFYLS